MHCISLDEQTILLSLFGNRHYHIAGLVLVEGQRSRLESPDVHLWTCP